MRRLAPIHPSAGFTLIELLVVIMMISLMMAVALPAFLGQQKKAMDAVAQEDLQQAFKQVEEARVANEGVYPAAATLRTEIAAGEPSFQVQIVRQAQQLADAPEHTVAVSLASTPEQVVLLAPSESGSIWRLQAGTDAKPTVAVIGERPAPPGEPFPWKTTGLVIGIILAILLVLAALSAAAVVYSRKRQMRLVTAQSLAAWADTLGEPGFDGPWMPEEGYEILVPEKHQEIVDGTRVDIDFRIALYRFVEGEWSLIDEEVTVEDLTHKTKTAKDAARSDTRKRFLKRLVGIRRSESAYPTVPEFELIERDLQLTWPAATDIAVLAEAWFDFQERVRTQNRMKWAQMEEQRIEDELRQEELERQLQVAELLEGRTTYDELSDALKQARPQSQKS